MLTASEPKTDQETIRRLAKACADQGGVQTFASKHGWAVQYIADLLAGKRKPDGAMRHHLRFVR